MKNLSRRAFLQRSMLVTSGSLLVPQFLKAFEKGSMPGAADRILIVLQLSGGNDGLNTVVPFRNDLYYKARPSLAINANRVLPATSELGFNPAMNKFHELFSDGYVSVINNVGYPNPDRSHFRSMDIWQTGSGSDEFRDTGWVGRYLDSMCDGCGSHSAVEIDDTLGLALRGAAVKGMAIKDPAKLYAATETPFYQEVAQGHSDEPTLAYLYKTMAETASNASYIYSQSKARRLTLEFPNTDFGHRLKTIAGLIQSGIETKVYYASLSGFDTHVRQAGQQERLLTIYSDAIHALVQALKASGDFERTLIMTFSEFGRRVEENASAGTDHGTANNLFLVGGKLKSPGIFNDAPDLTRLDHGDLIYNVDFRRIYATVLHDWLMAKDQLVLGKQFASLGLV